MPFRPALFAVVGLSLAVSACGGGGDAGVPGGGRPTPCPVGFTGTAPACTQTSASGTIAIGTTASSAPLPALAGYASSVQLPSASASTTATVTTSTQAPSGITTLSKRHVRSANAPLLYFTFVSAATVTLNGLPGFTVTLPSGVSPNQTFYVALFQAGVGWQTIAGPGTVTGQTVSFAPAGGSVTLTANQPLYLAFYAGAIVPSSCTSNSMTVTPCPLSFQGTGASHAQQVVASETGYSGAFNAQINTCTNVVTIAPASGTQFTVTPLAAGSCTLTISDTNGHTVALPVTVTVTQVGGQ